MTITTYGLIACKSSDGYSLHAPGSTDEEIASGEARYLVSEPWEGDDRAIPQSAYDLANARLACIQLLDAVAAVVREHDALWEKRKAELDDLMSAVRRLAALWHNAPRSDPTVRAIWDALNKESN
jgi:hypothetical protein